MVYTVKSWGPRREPWGTPKFNRQESDSSPRIVTTCLPVSGIGFKPIQSYTMDTQLRTKPVQQLLVVNRVKCSWQVKKEKNAHLPFIHSLQDVVLDTDECCFAAVPDATGRLKWLRQVKTRQMFRERSRHYPLSLLTGKWQIGHRSVVIKAFRIQTGLLQEWPDMRLLETTRHHTRGQKPIDDVRHGWDDVIPIWYCFNSHVGMASRSHELAGALANSLRISSWVAGRKEIT